MLQKVKINNNKKKKSTGSHCTVPAELVYTQGQKFYTGVLGPFSLLEYTNLSHPAIEFPFQEDLFSEKILEKCLLTMTLMSIGGIFNKHEF